MRRRAWVPRLVFEPESATGAGGAGTGGLRRGRHAPSPDAQIAIGPEGGFAADELEAFRVAGFSRVGLGPRILRTETAAIAALVWLQARFGDM